MFNMLRFVMFCCYVQLQRWIRRFILQFRITDLSSFSSSVAVTMATQAVMNVEPNRFTNIVTLSSQSLFNNDAVYVKLNL